MAHSQKEIPEGYTVKDCLCYGSRVPGMLEIKFHNPTKRNASNAESQLLMARLVENAQTDENIKVIFIHGGLFYNSGNDISRLASGTGEKKQTKEDMANMLGYGVEYCMT